MSCILIAVLLFILSFYQAAAYILQHNFSEDTTAPPSTSIGPLQTGQDNNSFGDDNINVTMANSSGGTRTDTPTISIQPKQVRIVSTASYYSTGSDSGSSLSGGAIAGIVIAVLVVLCCCCVLCGGAACSCRVG